MIEPYTSPWKSLRDAAAEPLAGGLINATWTVGEPPKLVLQRVNPIFGPEVHTDIEAVTRHLDGRGIATPRLIPTDTGSLYATDDDGARWRALTWVPGRTYHRLESPAHALNAGAFVARWHRAVSDLQHDFVHRRLGIHDTQRHMSRLASALTVHGRHRLLGAVEPLACQILALWAGWDGSGALPDRVSHGDLKVSNIRFNEGGEATCLLDLDTLGRMPVDAELGDAWRSWCNPGGEDIATARLDPALFEGAVTGYLRVNALTAEEREGLVCGVERIALELAARFAADALEERYFGFDPEIAPTRGEHNLLRARGQLALAASVREQRSGLESMVNAAYKGRAGA